MAETKSNAKQFVDGIVGDNPVLIQLLGMCPDSGGDLDDRELAGDGGRGDVRRRHVQPDHQSASGR